MRLLELFKGTGSVGDNDDSIKKTNKQTNTSSFYTPAGGLFFLAK